MSDRDDYPTCGHEGLECDVSEVCISCNDPECDCFEQYLKDIEEMSESIRQRQRKDLKERLDALVQRFGYSEADEDLVHEFYAVVGL